MPITRSLCTLLLLKGEIAPDNTTHCAFYLTHLRFSSLFFFLSHSSADAYKTRGDNYCPRSIPLISFHRIMTHCPCELKWMWTVIIASSLSLQAIQGHLETLQEHLASSPENYDDFRGNDEVLLRNCLFFFAADSQTIQPPDLQGFSVSGFLT